MSTEREARLLSLEVVRILAEERVKKGLSKYALAQKSGLSQQAIGYTERAQTAPSLETVARLAIAMELSLQSILADAERRVVRGEKRTE